MKDEIQMDVVQVQLFFFFNLSHLEGRLPCHLILGSPRSFTSTPCSPILLSALQVCSMSVSTNLTAPTLTSSTVFHSTVCITVTYNVVHMSVAE